MTDKNDPPFPISYESKQYNTCNEIFHCVTKFEYFTAKAMQAI